MGIRKGLVILVILLSHYKCKNTDDNNLREVQALDAIDFCKTDSSAFYAIKLYSDYWFSYSTAGKYDENKPDEYINCLIDNLYQLPAPDSLPSKIRIEYFFETDLATQLQHIKLLDSVIQKKYPHLFVKEGSFYRKAEIELIVDKR
jgi:hypothetical protein